MQINQATLETDPVTEEQYIEYGTMLKQSVYDGLGRLIRTTSPYPDPVTADPDTGTGETRSINFYYDGARRVQEVINEEVMAMEAALNSGDPELEQLAASSTTVSNPDPLSTPQGLEKGQNPDPSYSRAIHREYVWGPGDQGPDELLLQTDESDDEYWCLMDGGGDLVALVSVSGQNVDVVRQWTYDAYGAILTAEDLGPSLVTHVGHKGLFVDRLDIGVEEGGGESPRLLPYAHTIYQNRNRSYSPSLGRFLQPDPNQTAMALLSTTASHGRGLGAISIAFSMEGMYGDGMNLYQYLGSNPWTNSDPLGLSSDPFADIDALIDEIYGNRAAILSGIGKEAAATAIIAARIASYLPLPGVGIAGDLALVALGQESMDNVLIGAAIGIIPGGKLVKLFKKTGLGKSIGRLGSAAFKSAKGYAARGGAFLRKASGGIVNRAKALIGKKLGKHLADGPLDWAKVDKKFGSRYAHVQSHGADIPGRARHGVFDNDPVLTTESAWVRAQQSGISGNPSGDFLTYDVPMSERIGFSGGQGDGQSLDRIRIIIDPRSGTNQVVTAYPVP